MGAVQDGGEGIMPMGISFNKVFIAIPGGTFEPVSIQDVNVIADETLSPGEIAIDRINTDHEITGTFTMPPYSRKRLMRVLYRWKARGHIRYRVLHELWEMRARA